jgi:hypothetical protein
MEMVHLTVLFNEPDNNPDYTVLNDRRIWIEAVAAYFEVLSQQFLGHT